MNHKELVDKVSANLFREKGTLETRKSWLSIRNYLEQLDRDQLKSMLKEEAGKSFQI
tara:strand:- start:853 stop:1023 length:171 start_codon:yes stop_codon:yes gene_type:complete